MHLNSKQNQQETKTYQNYSIKYQKYLKVYFKIKYKATAQILI